MSCNWATRKLDELISIKHGFAFKGEFFTEQQTFDYLITPGNFAIGGGFKGDKFKYYNGPVPEDYILKVGALVVTMTDLSQQADTLGYSALIPELDNHQILHNQRVGLVHNISNEIDKEFLYFLLRSKEYRHHVVSGATGTTVKHTSPTKILSFEFQLPPIHVQKNIAKCLIALEQKATVNFECNKTLEEMAQAIFKSWFVDFDPVKAKMNGEQPEGMDEATASLFPEKLVETDLGEIPEGWTLVPVGKLLAKTIGGDWGKDDPDEKHTEEVRIVRGTDIPKLHGGALESVPIRFVEAKKLKTRMLERGDIVIEVSGGSKDQPTGRSLFISDNILKRLELPSEPASFCRRFQPVSYEIGLLLAVHFQLMYKAGKTWEYQNQSTGISNFQTTYFLEAEHVVVPSQDVLDAFVKQVSPMMDMIHSNQNIELAKLRDTLLPKLLSGEIDLAETTI